MYRERGGGGGGGGSRSEMGHVDRKRINEALDKQLERSSPSTSSRALNNGKDKDRLLAHSMLTSGKPPPDQRDSRSASLPETKRSDEESETDSEESDVSGSEGDDTSWISWFCNLRGNEFFSEVDDDYIQDDFNLCGLSSQVPYYDYALDLILDVESSHGDTFTEEQNELVESAAEMLYGLIHVRYILTSKGMSATLEKYKNAEFGRCPRVYCCGQPCLPVGQSDIPRQSTVKIYCPKCEDLYSPRSRFQNSILYFSCAHGLLHGWIVQRFLSCVSHKCLTCTDSSSFLELWYSLSPSIPHFSPFGEFQFLEGTHLMHSNSNEEVLISNITPLSSFESIQRQLYGVGLEN